jgi:tetratricopeptide (TPR) repeat protein
MKALSLRPADRYPAVEDLRRDIELFLEGRSVSAKQDSALELAKKFIKRNKGLSIGLAAAILVLLGSTVFIAKAWHDTGAAYAAYQDQVKKSVPAFVKAARLAAEQRLFDDAMKQVEIALASDENYAEARLLKAQLLIARQDFDAAAAELKQYIKGKPNDAGARHLFALCHDVQPDDIGRLLAFARLLSDQGVHALADGLLSKYGKNSDEARQFLLAMYRERLKKNRPGLEEHLWIDTAGLHWHFPATSPLTDLSPLKGIPLTTAGFRVSGVADLSPLQGMPLTKLICDNTQVADLTPLKGMPLTSLACDSTPIADLSPLAGMRLTELNCSSTRVQDLSPLKGMPLRTLLCGRSQVADLAPLNGMRLTSLQCGGPKLTDLTPLVGMPLVTLDCSGSPVADLSPLKGMPLKELYCYHTAVVDLSPLEELPLTILDCSGTAVSDLTPLRKMKLNVLKFPPDRVIKGIDLIRDMKSLASIGWGNGGGQSAVTNEFWQKYDAGEFHPDKKMR